MRPILFVICINDMSDVVEGAIKMFPELTLRCSNLQKELRTEIKVPKRI